MPATPDREPPETVLAFDFGRRRIGIAVGQAITSSASPLGTAENGSHGPDWRRITAVIEEWRPARLVVGLPLHADGTASELAADAARFRRALGRFGLPVESVDERYSSLEAAERLKEQRQAGRKGRVRKENVDAAAAVLIAERWLVRDRKAKIPEQ